MANENVKIIVQEVDETRPRGSGASSDIVYVPGLCNEFVSAEHRNVPTLCSSIDEFESYFGVDPYKFVQPETAYGVSVNAGDYDKAYIYAKELINAGLSVLYEAICPVDNALTNIGVFSSDTFTRVTNSKNVFSSTSDSLVEGTITFGLTGYPAYGKVSLVPRAGANMSAVVTNLEISNQKFVKTDPTVDADGNVTGNYVIEWTAESNITDADLEDVIVTATVAVAGVGHFSMNLVEGDVGPDALIGDTPLQTFYKELLDNRLDNLKDKNEYTVKYITSGGYPTFVPVAMTKGRNAVIDYPIANKMLEVACTRNDAVALIDHIDDPSAPLAIGDTGSVYYAANKHFLNASNAEFGAMFTPWGDYVCTTMKSSTASIQAMPASFGYLLCLATAIKTSPNWLAMAGVTRGIVPNLRRLRTDKILSNVLAENYQPKMGAADGSKNISINAITHVKPYGLTIWGNRTLKKVSTKGTVATNFLNTRNMISDIKKLAYNTAKSLMFEQDSDTLWLSFKSGVSPLLDQLKSGSGISDYKLIKNTTKYNGSALTRGEMSAIIKIFPVYAIEYFEITVVVSDNDVAIS